jgi:PKD repeat protein
MRNLFALKDQLLPTLLGFVFFIVFFTEVGAQTTLWTDKNENENYTARHECSFVQAGDKFYLMGGRENARTLDIYDYSSNSWNSLVNSAPVEFNHYQAIEYQGLIWVIGAFKTNAFPNETPADNIWVFDPVNLEWIQGPEIPQARKRGSSGLVVYNDKFYILAGNTIGHNGGYVAWFDEYDPALGKWTQLANAPRARDHFHAVVLGDKLYAAGGRLSGGTGGTFKPVIPEVDVYDFNSGTWITLPSGQNLPTPRAGASVVNFNNKLVLIGGEVQNELVYGVNIDDALKITEEYDPIIGIWTRLADLNFERHGTQAIVSGNGIFVVAGSPNRGGGNQKNMEFYKADGPQGSPSVASAISAPSNAVIFGGSSTDFDLSVIGGNVGVIVTSMELSGPNVDDFNLISGELSNGLLKPNSNHTVTIGLTGTGTNRSAVLTINYGNSSSVRIDLTSGNEPPVAVVSADRENGEAPLEVMFMGSNSTDDFGVTSYLWDFADGNTSTATDPTHIFTLGGTYNIELTVKDAFGLQDTETIVIKVNDNEGGLNALIYPNPAEDVANVQVINLPIDRLLINIALHDSSGRQIATFSPQTVFSNGVYEIPVATLRDGLYNISLETNSDMSIILSLIVKN